MKRLAALRRRQLCGITRKPTAASDDRRRVDSRQPKSLKQLAQAKGHVVSSKTESIYSLTLLDQRKGITIKELLGLFAQVDGIVPFFLSANMVHRGSTCYTAAKLCHLPLCTGA